MKAHFFYNTNKNSLAHVSKGVSLNYLVTYSLQGQHGQSGKIGQSGLQSG